MRQDSALPGYLGPTVFAACAVVLLLAWLAARAPLMPVPEGPPPSGFAAGRAQAHLRLLAQAPRPPGSAANARARDYLMRQIRALGLEPEIQVASAQAASVDLTANVRITLAEARNIVVRKRGTGARRDTVLASARYDSAFASNGAADGAASAAALLETLRVLQAGAPLHNDLLFVFTDADTQVLGTRGFAESHPWARHVRIALRFDNPGNRGPLALVDGSRADGTAIKAWARLAPDARGSSLMAALLASLPQRAAVAPLAAHGASVLQFATIDGPLGPGGMHDLAQQLGDASLQHEGDTMLALLRHFGNAALAPAGARGQTWFALPLIGQVHYATLLAWPLALLACALNLAACRTALRRLDIPASDIVHGLFGFFFMSALAIFLAWLCREALAGLQARYDIGVLAGDASVRWQVLAFLLLPAAAFAVLQRQLQRRLGPDCAALGAMLAAGVALLAVCYGAPEASYVLAWPLLAAQAAWLVLASRRARAWPAGRRLAVLLAAAVPALALIVPAAWDSAAWLSPRWLLLPAMLACLLLALCGMLLAQVALWLVAAPLLLAGAACIGMAYAQHPVAPTLPAPNRLLYLADTPSWQAYWIHPAGPLDALTRRLIPNAMQPYVMPYTFGRDSDPVWYGAAPRAASVAYPYLLVEKDELRGDVRHVELLLRSKNAAPEITLRLIGTDSLRTSVNGRVLTDRRYRGWHLTLNGMGERELRFAFDLPGDPEFTLFVQERLPGIPDTGLPGAAPPPGGTTISVALLRFP